MCHGVTKAIKIQKGTPDENHIKETMVISIVDKKEINIVKHLMCFGGNTTSSSSGLNPEYNLDGLREKSDFTDLQYIRTSIELSTQRNNLTVVAELCCRHCSRNNVWWGCGH